MTAYFPPERPKEGVLPSLFNNLYGDHFSVWISFAVLVLFFDSGQDPGKFFLLFHIGLAGDHNPLGLG